MSELSLMVSVFALIFSLSAIISNIIPFLTKISDNYSRISSVVIPVILFLMVILIWYYYVKNSNGNPEIYNTLFTGLAFSGTLYNMYVQSRQIQGQFKEVQIQRFETSLFQLLTLHSEIVKSMDYRDDNSKLISTGRDVFRTYYNQLAKNLEEFKKQAKEIIVADFNMESLNTKKNKYIYTIPLDDILGHYDTIFKNRESDLGHYFRSLYHIYRFLDESEIQDKLKYGRIIRGQLSTYELVFLFYNGLSEHGEEFKTKYMEKYEVLKNMGWDPIFDKSHIQLYEHLRGYYEKSQTN